MKLINKYNKGFMYLLCAIAIDPFGKYALIVSIKYKKSVSVVNAFQSILDSLKRRPNKVWVDPGTEYYNNFFKKMVKKWWHKNVFNF